jgi:hypothetical protein
MGTAYGRCCDNCLIERQILCTATWLTTAIGRTPARSFHDPPAKADRERALAHQTRLTITAAEVLRQVGRAWKTASKG